MLTKKQKTKEAKKSAMPAVKALVKRHGMTAISGCLTILKNQAKTTKKIEALRREADRLQKMI